MVRYHCHIYKEHYQDIKANSTTNCSESSNSLYKEPIKCYTIYKLSMINYPNN